MTTLVLDVTPLAADKDTLFPPRDKAHPTIRNCKMEVFVQPGTVFQLITSI